MSVGKWENRLAIARYVVRRRRWPRRHIRALGMHLTLEQNFRGLPRPTNVIRRVSPGEFVAVNPDGTTCPLPCMCDRHGGRIR